MAMETAESSYGTQQLGTKSLPSTDIWNSVETLHFSPDGNTLVSAGQDGTILLWDWDAIVNSLPLEDK